MNTNELVAGGSDVKVWLLLVDKEGVGYPNVLDEFRADAERLDARSLLERESWIRPELSEVKIQREVLVRHRWLIRLEVGCVHKEYQRNTRIHVSLSLPFIYFVYPALFIEFYISMKISSSLMKIDKNEIVLAELSLFLLWNIFFKYIISKIKVT